MQDPVLAHARITEGINPLLMNRGDFYVSGVSWAKVHAHQPWLSFEYFWSNKEHIYDYRNADTNRFFLRNFQRDLEKHVKILADRVLRHEIK